MSTVDRGSLKAAFAGFKVLDAERNAEMRLLGRVAGEDAEPPAATTEPVIVEIAATVPPPTPPSPAAATAQIGSLTPRPLLQREAVRQLSFRCPVSLAADLRRKAVFNQLEHQEIIVEGLRRVLMDLQSPPEGWQEP